jgi:uncharacterized membrane protein
MGSPLLLLKADIMVSNWHFSSGIATSNTTFNSIVENHRKSLMHGGIMPNPKSTASIAGHPIHPMVIPLPIAFLVSAFLTDVVAWQSGNATWAIASMWLIGAAIVMALLAALFGFTDFFCDEKIRAISSAWYHMIGNLVAVVLALINFFIRYKSGAMARAKNSVLVAPGIKQVTVTPESLSSARSANEKESRKALVPL